MGYPFNVWHVIMRTSGEAADKSLKVWLPIEGANLNQQYQTSIGRLLLLYRVNEAGYRVYYLRKCLEEFYEVSHNSHPHSERGEVFLLRQPPALDCRGLP